MGSKIDLSKILQTNKDHAVYHANWTGSFQDYVDLVKEDPRITRNAFQRIYDMVVEAGTEEYIDFKKPVFRYKFFDDPKNNGKDAVYGLDVPIMKLVNVLKAAALGYGTEKRVVLLHGPVGSAKSTICRLLKRGIEQYSKTQQGSMYTFEWVDERGELGDLFGKDQRLFVSPMHEEPLLLIPEESRAALCEEINRGQSGTYRVSIEGELSPPSRFIFK
ncbi:MAG: serine protein kinase, partial [Bdellovibrio sp.]